MRPDAAGPRTWLLAVLAAWALAVLLLALAGLGGRVVPLDDDPSLAQALPRLAPPPPPRLVDLQAYAQTRDRPLFNRDRRPQPFLIGGGGGEEVSRDFDFVLTSVLITPRLRMAILQPSGGGESVRVREGASPDSLPNWQLVEVRPRSASFVGPEGPRTLELRVFNGSSAGAPTAMSMGAPPVAPPPGGNAQPPDAVTDAAQGPLPTERPGPMAQNAGSQATPPGAPADQSTQSTQQQMDAIRQRIEARRAQLREAQDPPTAPGQTR